MRLKNATVALVYDRAERRELLEKAFRGEGAIVTSFDLDAAKVSALGSDGWDTLVVDLGTTSLGFAPALALRLDDFRSKRIPIVLSVEGEAKVNEIAPLRAARVVAWGSGDGALLTMVADAVDQGQAEIARKASLRHESMVTHDARVLLGVVIGFACNLRDGVAGPLGAMQQENVKDILEAATNANALLTRYGTEVARQWPKANEERDESEESVAFGRIAAQRTQQDLSALVKAAVSLFGGIAANMDIDLTFTEEDPATLWCDAMQIRQVVANLVLNALKFTPAGGKISIVIRAVPDPEANGKRKFTELVVSDTGLGIPLEDRERVFQHGTRLERDAEVEGSGIGLAVVRELVELHGGTVRIEDTPGGGACFRIALPNDLRERADGENPRAASASKAPSAQSSVPGKAKASAVAVGGTK